MLKKIEIGDFVGIYISSGTGTLQRGRVIHQLNLNQEQWVGIYYIIEVPTTIDHLLEIRTAHTLFPAPPPDPEPQEFFFKATITLNNALISTMALTKEEAIEKIVKGEFELESFAITDLIGVTVHSCVEEDDGNF